MIWVARFDDEARDSMDSKLEQGSKPSLTPLSTSNSEEVRLDLRLRFASLTAFIRSSEACLTLIALISLYMYRERVQSPLG